MSDKKTAEEDLAEVLGGVLDLLEALGMGEPPGPGDVQELRRLLDQAKSKLKKV